MDCGGREKRRHRFKFAGPSRPVAHSRSHDEAKALSPLLSATAVHIAIGRLSRAILSSGIVFGLCPHAKNLKVAEKGWQGGQSPDGTKARRMR